MDDFVISPLNYMEGDEFDTLLTLTIIDVFVHLDVHLRVVRDSTW